MKVAFHRHQEDDRLDRCDSRKPTRSALGCLEQTVDGLEKFASLACGAQSKMPFI